MGSGHILIAMFDVLMDIYESAGYDKREAAFEIIEHNIHGLDIDQRAYQLAYFAVMMKGRGYNRRFLYGEKVVPHVYQIKESGYIDKNGERKYSFDQATLDYFIGKNVKLKESMENLIYQMFDALEYGSIIKIENVDFKLIFDRLNEVKEEISLYKNSVSEGLYPFILVGYMLATHYDAVVTNPPYMGASGMGVKLSKYVKDNYPDSKSDLFAVFIEKCGQMAKKNGYQAMITQHAWMFLSSFEKLRNKLQMIDIVNMAHLGPRAFEEIAGEVVQTTSFIMQNSYIEGYKGIYCRLIAPTTQQGKEKMFLDKKNRYHTEQRNFSKIPGSPVAYWASETILNAYNKGELVGDISDVKIGMGTGKNEIFVREWWEVEYNKIDFTLTSMNELDNSAGRYFPYNKGGEFRLWYGNLQEVLWFDAEGRRYMNTLSGHRENGARDWYCHEGLTWSFISTSKFGIRFLPSGCFFDVAGSTLFSKKDNKYTLGFLASCVCFKILGILNPTLNYQAGNIKSLPIIFSKEKEVDALVDKNIILAKKDWDSFETSWDFKKNPLIYKAINTSEVFKQWENKCHERFNQMKENEEALNRIFIDTYNLHDELTPEIMDEDVTVQKANLDRDIRGLISYAIGCMFGRYSLDEEGLIYAGGEWNTSSYKTFLPDEDNCIPITDEEYFTDDIVGRFVEFVKTVYGADTLEENLDFIAKALGNKGNTSREVIRNYFLKDFYVDHLKVYQKRPIYWLFDSGKQNGFKALIYMHRYNADTVGRVRTDYLHRAQKYVETAMQSAQYTIDNASSASEKSKATKAVTKYTKQLAEMKIYDEAIAHIANKRIEIDLDDGVKVNYAKFQGVEVAQEGKKALKVDLLAKLK